VVYLSLQGQCYLYCEHKKMKNNTNNNIDNEFNLMLDDVEQNKDYNKAEQIEGCLEVFMQENNLASSLVERAVFLFLKLSLDKELSIQEEVAPTGHFFLSTGHFY
jgi:hypothetical protein